MHTLRSWVLPTAIVLLSTATAAAQNVEGKFHLGLSTQLFSHSSATVEAEDSGTEVETTATRWGVREGVILELGYGLSELLVLGALVSLGGESQTIETPGSDQEVSSFAATIGPKLDLVLSEGASTRPFLSLAAGLSSTSGDTATGDVSMLGVELLARLGVRVFAAPGLSIDPAVGVGWATTSGDVDTGATNVDVSGTGFAVQLLLGVSGWI